MSYYNTKYVEPCVVYDSITEYRLNRQPISINFPPGAIFLQPGLTEIPVWISIRMSNKLWNEITYPFPNFNGAAVKFGNGYMISAHTLLWM